MNLKKPTEEEIKAKRKDEDQICPEFGKHTKGYLMQLFEERPEAVNEVLMNMKNVSIKNVHTITNNHLDTVNLHCELIESTDTTRGDKVKGRKFEFENHVNTGKETFGLLII